MEKLGETLGTPCLRALCLYPTTCVKGPVLVEAIPTTKILCQNRLSVAHTKVLTRQMESAFSLRDFMITYLMYYYTLNVFNVDFFFLMLSPHLNPTLLNPRIYLVLTRVIMSMTLSQRSSVPHSSLAITELPHSHKLPSPRLPQDPSRCSEHSPPVSLLGNSPAACPHYPVRETRTQVDSVQ